MAYGLHVAGEVVNTILTAAQKVPNSPLKRVLLYGDIVEKSVGNDIDVIIVVDTGTFSRYVGHCVLILGGVRPFSDDLLKPLHNKVFDHSSSKGPRSEAALKAIGVDIERLHLGAIKESLDVVCLPEGWSDESSDIHQELKLILRGTRDPDFVERAMRHKVQLFPLI